MKYKTIRYEETKRVDEIKSPFFLTNLSTTAILYLVTNANYKDGDIRLTDDRASTRANGRGTERDGERGEGEIEEKGAEGTDLPLRCAHGSCSQSWPPMNFLRYSLIFLILARTFCERFKKG